MLEDRPRSRFEHLAAAADERAKECDKKIRDFEAQSALFELFANRLGEGGSTIGATVVELSIILDTSEDPTEIAERFMQLSQTSQSAARETRGRAKAARDAALWSRPKLDDDAATEADVA